MEKKLERNQQNKMIAGVASGLADYLSLDVTLVRILFIILFVFGFSGVLIYIALWIAVPEKPFYHNFSNMDADYKVSEESSNTFTGQQQTHSIEKKSDSGRLIAGLLLIAIGCWFMLAEFNIIPHWFSIFKLWPVILIAIGLVILSKSGKKKPVSFTDTKPPVTNWDTKSQNDATDKVDDQPLA